jgi:hypothetical protein
MVDFSSLLMSDFPEPKMLPKGTYFGTIVQREFGTGQNENEYPYLRLHIRATSAKHPDNIRDIDLSTVPLRIDYWLTAKSGYRLVRLCDALGVKTSGKTATEIAEELLQQEIMFRGEPNEKGFFNISDMSAIPPQS